MSDGMIEAHMHHTGHEYVMVLSTGEPGEWIECAEPAEVWE